MTEKTVFTEYAKVTESHLVQLEIHVLGEIEEDASWFNKQTHVKEITDVLMPVMQNRVTRLCERKTDKRPRKELTPLHVDGSSLRLAYSFKRRSPLHQCVLINCTERSLRSRCCRSLPVFSEKLVVHAYHLAGYYKLEAIAQSSEQTLLSYKFGVAIRSTSRTTESESTTSVYFDEDESCTQPHQRTLRNIVKKSGPKLSKSKITKPVEQKDSVESLWTTLEDEDDLSKTIHGMSSCIVSSVTAGSTMLMEDPLMTIEDSGFYQEERLVANTNTFDEIRKSDGFSSISDSDESKNVENPKMLAHSKTKWNHCSEEERDMSAVVANVECHQDKTPTKKHSMAESAAFQQKYRDKAAKLTTNSNKHTELSTRTNGSCVSDDNDIKEQCDKEDQPNSLGLLKPSQQDCILSDSEPMCHPRDGEKEQRKLRLKKTTKRVTPSTSPASSDISGCDIRAVDSGSPAWKISRLADTQTMGTSASLEKTAPKNHKQVEKPYRNCRSRNPTPNDDAVSLVSQHCADITLPSDTVKPKATKNGVPSPSTRHEKKPKQLEKQYTNSRSRNPTPNDDTVSPVSEHCVDITQSSYTVPDGTKNTVTSPSTQHGNAKATKKAMPVVSTGKILRTSKRMKLSKGKKMNNKLALLLKEMEAESPSSKDRVAAQGCGRTGLPLANKKTSDKLATILKEMENDIHINSSDICNNSGTKGPSRARAALVSDSFVITERNSLDKDPFREPTKMRWLEEPGVKTKKTKAGCQLSGDVTVQRSRGGSPGKLTKVELGRSRTTPKSCVDDKRPGLALKDTNNIRQREFSMPQNVTKDRRQVNKLPKKTQSLSYRMNSDSDLFLMNRNDFPVASRRSSSVGRVNLYFRQAMQHETRPISQEKMADKEDEDTENALIKDLLNDCFIDETKTKPPVVDTLPEQTIAEIAQIKNVCDLTEEQLIYMVKKNTQYLKDIFEGKEQCRRHNDYKEGGKTRSPEAWSYECGHTGPEAWSYECGRTGPEAWSYKCGRTGPEAWSYDWMYRSRSLVIRVWTYRSRSLVIQVWTYRSRSLVIRLDVQVQKPDHTSVDVQVQKPGHTTGRTGPEAWSYECGRTGPEAWSYDWTYRSRSLVIQVWTYRSRSLVIQLDIQVQKPGHTSVDVQVQKPGHVSVDVQVQKPGHTTGHTGPEAWSYRSLVIQVWTYRSRSLVIRVWTYRSRSLVTRVWTYRSRSLVIRLDIQVQKPGHTSVDVQVQKPRHVSVDVQVQKPGHTTVDIQVQKPGHTTGHTSPEAWSYDCGRTGPVAWSCECGCSGPEAWSYDWTYRSRSLVIRLDIQVQKPGHTSVDVQVQKPGHTSVDVQVQKPGHTSVDVQVQKPGHTSVDVQVQKPGHTSVDVQVQKPGHTSVDVQVQKPGHTTGRTGPEAWSYECGRTGPEAWSYECGRTGPEAWSYECGRTGPEAWSYGHTWTYRSRSLVIRVWTYRSRSLVIRVWTYRSRSLVIQVWTYRSRSLVIQVWTYRSRSLVIRVWTYRSRSLVIRLDIQVQKPGHASVDVQVQKPGHTSVDVQVQEPGHTTGHTGPEAWSYECGRTVALNYQVRLNLFSEEQPDIIVSALVAIFCKKTGSKYLDYVLKVLLPEILIKIYMDMHGTSYPDTEEIMAQARPMQQDF
ncbi:hypothetical protein LSAT2_018879 [Lamellibrachia satsuma]|nr:hypothetical protein LSAT2_018879 [Lamellibrachia satsuma]